MSRRAQNHLNSALPTFGAVLSNLTIESVHDPDRMNQLRLHTWDGRTFRTAPTVNCGGHTYTPVPIAGGLTHAVRFPVTSKSFGSSAQLIASMFEFLSRYTSLTPDAASLLVAFAMSSWFPDCVPVAPILYLLGPDYEAGSVLRLLGCLCRRPILLGDIDIAALATLPSQLEATLLINQRNLARPVARVLMASNNRYFCIARGGSQLHAYGAKAFSADPEFENGAGVRVSLPPALEPLPTLTSAEEKECANEFQAKLLRYRMLSYRRVCNARLDTRDFVPSMREQVRAWLAPVCDCPEPQKSVSASLLQQSREAEGDRLSDDRCLVAEAALFFCHKANTREFFIGELAEIVNDLLKGRHEERSLTDKKVGSLLRALGIHGKRVVKGYRIVLTDSVREQIHKVARAYQVGAILDGVRRCDHCPEGKVNGGGARTD